MFFPSTALVRRTARPAFAFEKFLNNAMAAPLSSTRFEEDEKFVTLRFDVPGVSREQLTIQIEDNVVSVKSVDDAPRNYRFAVELADIDTTGSEARLDLGVLTLKLAKRQPVNTAQQLTIQ
ncbi:MAG: Hsp20/alpha crystallin family protein [Burkholderiaceae bacterium]|nr:Hsp20/alpha crystallin family protein [Burkholderiaceae bacterium]